MNNHQLVSKHPNMKILSSHSYIMKPKTFDAISYVSAIAVAIVFALGLFSGMSFTKIGLDKVVLTYSKIAYHIENYKTLDIGLIVILSTSALSLLVFNSYYSTDRISLYVTPQFYLSICVLLGLVSYLYLSRNFSGFLEYSIFLIGVIIAEILRSIFRVRPKVTRSIIYLFVVIFSIFSLLSPTSGGEEYTYSGYVRWSGIWRNPNTFGLFMMISIIVVLNIVLKSSMNYNEQRSSMSDLTLAKLKIMIIYIFGAYSSGILFFGLLHSFSRSSLILLLVGIMLMLFLHRNYLITSKKIGVVCVFIAMLFCGAAFIKDFRFSRASIQRIAESTNLNDRSVRNRIVSWRDCIKMLKDRPLLGWGWGQAEKTFSEKYNFSYLNNTTSIKTNSYLIMGISSGIPALISFLAYLFFSLTPLKISWVTIIKQRASEKLESRKYVLSAIEKDMAYYISLFIVPALLAAVMPLINPGLFTIDTWPLLAVLVVLSYENSRYFKNSKTVDNLKS